MTSKIIRETMAKARDLGLVDVQVGQRKKHAFLTGRHSETGKQVVLALSKGSHCNHNHRLPAQIMTNLRRQLRA